MPPGKSTILVPMEEKHTILVAGAGKIGIILAALLASTGDYSVYLADIDIEPAKKKLADRDNLHLIQCDVLDHSTISQLFQTHSFHAVISSLPYHCNIAIATLAKTFECHYFDLTEDIEVAQAIDKLAKGAKTAFVPQCGVAPGFINIVANDLILQFDKADIVKLRCGALPESSINALQYALTWSTEGLINEYKNPCIALENGKITKAHPLSECEALQIDGTPYEAFQTSGGIGSLAETYAGKINTMNYKSIRYPGHCEKMRFLMHDLKLKDDPKNLQSILENAIPYTNEDVVIVYVRVEGTKDNKNIYKTYVHKFYPSKLANLHCSAIQATTASGACAVIDTVLKAKNKYHGRIKQEAFSLSDIRDNRFAIYLNTTIPSPLAGEG